MAKPRADVKIPMPNENTTPLQTRFMAPCVLRGRVRARLSGLVHVFTPEPSYEGWGVFRASGETTAVLDDEAAVGKALGRLLGARHQVTTFVRAQDALAHVTSGHRFDAILCDLMMPEMSGSQFHRELERLAPEQAQRVIFMTGGAFTEETRAFLSTARNPCMDKPLDIQRLLSLLELLPAVGSSQEVPWFGSTA